MKKCVCCAVLALFLSTSVCCWCARPAFSQEQPAGDTQTTTTLDMKKAEAEVESHYGKASPAIQEYVLWTARTFGTGGMWLHEDAFATLSEDALQKGLPCSMRGYGRTQTLLPSGWGRSFLPASAK